MTSQQNDNRNYRRQMYEALHTQSSSAFQSLNTVDENGNGTDKSESGEIIHWKFVPPDVKFELVKLLNPPAPLSGNDWRMLAHELEYTVKDINFFESEKDNNTSVLFRYYDEKPGASFNDVYKSLAKMQREDCVDILNTAFDRIKQAYIQAQRALRFHMAGIRAPLLTEGHNQSSNHSCPCPQAGHLTCAYGSHTYCPCGNGYTICGCVGNNHLHSHPTYHSMLPQPYQLETSQPACAAAQTPPSHTYSVHKNVTKNPQTHLSHPGYAEEGRYSTDVLRSPAGSFLRHQPHVHRHGPGSPARSLNVNVTGASTVMNRNTRRDTDKQKVNRQYSEDCNVMPDFHTDKRFRNKCNGNGIGTDQVGTCVAADHVDGNMEAAGCSTLPNSGNRLNGLDERMVHLGRSLSDGKVKTNFLQDSSDGPTGMISCHSNTRQSLVEDHRKAKHDQTIEVSKDSRIFKMSLSMPADMKPKAFRKVRHHSKVFVTCSNDNDLHTTDVKSLCRFLLHNGFPCYVDFRNDGASDRGTNSQNSYSQNLAEADFVLVCISNKYIEDIAPERSSLRNNQLHTREIYELLNSKHLDSIHSNTSDIAQRPKVIPLLFDSMTQNQIPTWMRGGHTFKWPEEYMGLVKLLAKQR